MTLVSREAEPGSVTPVRSVRAPTKVQGAASGPGGIWYASSTTYCGVLHLPGGGSLPFIPGAEGIAFAGERLWVVSESGAGRYQRQGGRPVVPTLQSLDPGDLDEDGPTGCSWD